MQTEKGLTEDLRRIVGPDNVHEATEEDAVEGVEPDFVVEPGSVEEISDVMKLAPARAWPSRPGQRHEDAHRRPAAPARLSS